MYIHRDCTVMHVQSTWCVPTDSLMLVCVVIFSSNCLVISARTTWNWTRSLWHSPQLTYKNNKRQSTLHVHILVTFNIAMAVLQHCHGCFAIEGVYIAKWLCLNAKWDLTCNEVVANTCEPLALHYLHASPWPCIIYMRAHRALHCR